MLTWRALMMHRFTSHSASAPLCAPRPRHHVSFHNSSRFCVDSQQRILSNLRRVRTFILPLAVVGPSALWAPFIYERSCRGRVWTKYERRGKCGGPGPIVMQRAASCEPQNRVSCICSPLQVLYSNAVFIAISTL
ncbi:hypothetical protein BOTBODRAFT_39264 [Botryobasidium botryosum FD-172 SS1]|uniref:Uncharacterized protein n=1 Tax=Botryobasidium botryosum (strain FD-172 SS1) TaxID=930990 RepID=A0A067M4X1_BOTB1|nr:hypothetical protein BOTBODRAFT_39264 [Botryobasidium botryosum FD-172 SS1]